MRHIIMKISMCNTCAVYFLINSIPISHKPNFYILITYFRRVRIKKNKANQIFNRKK